MSETGKDHWEHQPRCPNCGCFCGEVVTGSTPFGPVWERCCLSCGLNVPECSYEDGTVSGCTQNATHRAAEQPNRHARLWCEEHAPDGFEPLPYVEGEYVGTQRVATDGGTEQTGIEHWTRESDLLGEVFEARCPSCGSVCSSIFGQETAVEGAEECCDDGLRADGGPEQTGTERIAESVGDVPVCEGCGLGGRMHFDTGICPDCFNRRNGWQGGGQIRVVTSAGTYHETALCPAVQQANVWWQWRDEDCCYADLVGDLKKCVRCHRHSLYGFDEFSGDEDRQKVIGHV